MTHTEKVHVVFGVLAAVTGGLALWRAYRPLNKLAGLWPIIAFLIGFCLFIPVEAQTRTYLEVGWWDTILSVIPDSPQYWFNNWFDKLASWHVVQHKVGGLLIMIVGVVEWQRAHGRLATSRSRFALPVLLVAIGLAFGIHGGSAAHLPYRAEQIHHRIFGVAFVLAGLVQALVGTGRLGGGWRGAWALVILLVGLDIAFLYRLDPRELTNGAHHHESTGSGVR